MTKIQDLIDEINKDDDPARRAAMFFDAQTRLSEWVHAAEGDCPEDENRYSEDVEAP